jgi:hypothetical protein
MIDVQRLKGVDLHYGCLSLLFLTVMVATAAAVKPSPLKCRRTAILARTARAAYEPALTMKAAIVRLQRSSPLPVAEVGTRDALQY